jgi:hypothetical protein
LVISICIIKVWVLDIWFRVCREESILFWEVYLEFRKRRDIHWGGEGEGIDVVYIVEPFLTQNNPT